MVRATTGRALPRARPAARPQVRPAARPVVARPARPLRPQAQRRATPEGRARTRFVFLVIGLLAGGLLSLLLINTVLAAGSFRITALQQGNVTLLQHEKTLQAQIAAQESPSSLARRAHRLGMVEPPLIHFLNLTTGRVASERAHMAGVPAASGYTPCRHRP